MKLVRIDERLPDDPLASEVVLHLRRHLRTAIRNRSKTVSRDLAHIFGFARAEGDSNDWVAAAVSKDPIQAGATVAAKRRGSKEGVIAFGHDAGHVLACKAWLAERKMQDEAFAAIKASDLATLLELSRARDVALARGVDSAGRDRFLPVLIQGPTGSGKELLAEAIHTLWAKSSSIAEPPFEVVQVGGMPPDMISDELFGHVRGAFTGAERDRRGRLEAADGGTLLIDEVGDLPAEAQVRLLRFLQTQAISRTGENEERQLSVRVIAATWHDLDADVAAGRFREDLLHRLRVGSGLVLPPLREREGVFDLVVPELLRARRHAAEPALTRSARDALALHHWPGNLRELVGVLDEVVSLAAGETIRLEHLPPHFQRKYLKLPLHSRAVGFLLEEVDGQGLPDDHIVWRIGEISTSLAAVPVPPKNDHLATVGRFLSLIDDSSDEHRKAVSEVGRLLELDQGVRHAEVAAAFWEDVVSVGPPANVARLIEQATQQAKEARASLQREIEAVQRVAAIDSDPWLRLFRELQDLPLLRDTNPGELANAFIGLFNLVKLVGPAAIERVREDARVGGFAKLREGFFAMLKEAHDDETRVVETTFAPRQKAASLKRAEWVALSKKYPTQRAATEATGFDPKTLAKYFGQHKIRNPWKAS